MSVFVSKRYSGDRIYHTDPECSYLEPARRRDEVELDSLSDDFRECKLCADEVESRGQGEGHYQSLRAAAKQPETATDGGERR